MKYKKNKGFTLVELVIVIAVIAILAAVLIPTFASLIAAAKMSADQQVVTNMNLVLQTSETSADGKPEGVADAFNYLRDSGYNVPLETSSKGYAFYWIKEDNRIVLVQMNDDDETPKQIVFPKNLASKYESELPAEGAWFTLRPEKIECDHDPEYGYTYSPIALVTGGSECHMVICGNCKEVIVRDVTHIYNCDKDGHKLEDVESTPADQRYCICGYQKVTNSETQPCLHAYREGALDKGGSYSTHNDGTHTKVCAICNEAVKEKCTLDSSGKCVHCGYQSPAPEHVHNYTFAPAADTLDGKKQHTATCMTNDGTACDNKSYTVECTLFRREGNDYYCAQCGQQITPDLKTGVYDGYYYKDDKLFTGTEDGHEFEYGKLVVTDDNPIKDEYDSDIIEWNFNLPEEKYLTDNVVLKFTEENTHFEPGESFINKVEFTGTLSDSYQTVDIRTKFELNIVGAMNMLKEAIDSGKTNNVLAKIEVIYSIGEDYYPLLVKSNYFINYLEFLGCSTDTNRPISQEDYNKYRIAETSYAQYLKDNYSIQSFDKVPWNMQADINYPYSNSLGGGNVCTLNSEPIHCYEPELVLWFWNFTYSHVYWYAISEDDLTTLYNDAWYGSGSLYNDMTENWKAIAGPKYGATIYATIELYNGVELKTSSDKTFSLVSGTHSYFMTNMWQEAGIVPQEFEVMLEKAA